MALAWKAGWVNALAGSNPASSAIFRSAGRPTAPWVGAGGSVGIAVGVVRLPAPGVLAHLVDRARGAPPELVLGARGVGVRLCDVAGAARRDLERYVVPAGPRERVEHLLDRGGAARAEVPRRDRGVGHAEPVESRDVAGGEVLDV